MNFLFSNTATATLASSVTAAATTIQLNSGAGSQFPAPAASAVFHATLADVSGNTEIVRVTARATDTLTVVRAQEGTSARNFAAGSRFELRLTAESLASFAQLDSPDFEGEPTAPTPTAGDSSGRLANTEFVASAIAVATGPDSIPMTSLAAAVRGLINGALQVVSGAAAALFKLAGDATDVLHPTTKQQVDAALALACPPGTIQPMARLTAPSRWLLIDGKTIGNAASGATARANADTWLLYEQVWAFPAASAPIYDSAGTLSTRGASAAADFAANKRLSLFTPDGGAFLRMWTPGQTKDAGRAAGSLQQDAFQGHEHDAYVTAITHTLDGGGLGLGTGNHNGTTFGITNKPGFSPARVADETRPYNLSMPHYIFLGVTV